MAEKKLTHEEADRRILEAAKPPKQAGTGLLGKLKEMAGKRQAGAGTAPPASQGV